MAVLQCQCDRIFSASLFNCPKCGAGLEASKLYIAADQPQQISEPKVSSLPVPTVPYVPPAARPATENYSSLSNSSIWDQQISSFKFIAGDLGSGTGHLLANGKVSIPGGAQVFPLSALSTVEIASEASVKRVGGALGWGLAGAALFGPAGLIVGGLLGGRGSEVTFVGVLADGKRFLATAKKDIFAKFQAAAF